MTGVVHIITQLERGGAQRNTLETAAQLHDPGRPQLLFTGEPGALDDEARTRLGPRLVRVPHLVRAARPFADAQALAALTSLLSSAVARLRAPVIVHTHSTKAGVLGRLAARAIPGVVVVHTVHGFGFEAFGEKRAWLVESAERIAAQATDVFVFVSSADRERAEALGLVRADATNVRVIRSGVDAAHFAPTHASFPAPDLSARERAGVPPGAHLAVVVANLKPQKDPLFHVDVLAAWRQLDPAAHMLFAGDGPLKDAVLAHARARGVADALTLSGFVDDPRPLYAAADAFLLASAWEGLPRTVLEATAAQLPCVVRDTGWAQDLSWARTVRALPATATAADFAHALVHATHGARAMRAKPVKLPRAFTLAGMLAELRTLYDTLVGMPLPVGDERRWRSARGASQATTSRPRRRRRSPPR